MWLIEDVGDPLPFDAEFFDPCDSHMLFCLARTTVDLECLSDEIRRALEPNGLNVYTVTHIGDSDYGKEIRQGEVICEVNGFTVHYFSGEKIRRLAEADVLEFQEIQNRKELGHGEGPGVRYGCR